MTHGARAAGTGLLRRPNGAAKACRRSSTPPAPRCGTRASMAFGVGPLLTMGGDRRAQCARQRRAQARLSGKARHRRVDRHDASHRAAGRLRCRRVAHARRARADGSYRITGQKIFITYGEHDLTDNIIHFVLARLPDAPPGTRGISLFLVPNSCSMPTARPARATMCARIRSSTSSASTARPTCTMVFGDHGGATGFLIGEENAGMACMFTMMNRARLAVGLQGVGIAERATQQAIAYARERRQGRTTGMPAKQSAPIIAHPDVKRMLMTMRALTQAARAICYATAVALDRAERGTDEARARGRACARLAAHAGRQGVFHRYRHRSRLARRPGAWRHGLHRGDRRGAALSRRAHRRDLRGHQRHPGDRSRHPQAAACVAARRSRPISANCAASSRRSNATNDPALRLVGRAARRSGRQPDARDGVAAGPSRRRHAIRRWPARRPICVCLRSPRGGCLLAQQALAALRLNTEAGSRSALARFFAENIAVQAPSLERTIVEGGGAVLGAEAALAE